MPTLTYKIAGVDIDKADAFIRKIKPIIRSTKRPEVLGDIGGFSGLFLPRIKAVKNPVLVSSTDGVGTKLLIAELMNRYDTIGIDLVAMCVDDVVVTGAEPLFFLDYIACGRIRREMLVDVVRGIARGCRQSNCALIGGETAELPGMYGKNEWDLAGFCVGLVSREKMIDGRRCRRGDRVIGLASSGLHSNGYSLVRRVFSAKEIRAIWGKELLKPTKIYAPYLLRLMGKIRVKAAAHITGGGIYDNIPRILPQGAAVEIYKGTWPIPGIFSAIQKRGSIGEKEMFRTFNMGIGMILIVKEKDASPSVSMLKKFGQNAWIIGEVIPGKQNVRLA